MKRGFVVSHPIRNEREKDGARSIHLVIYKAGCGSSIPTLDHPNDEDLSLGTPKPQ